MPDESIDSIESNSPAEPADQAFEPGQIRKLDGLEAIRVRPAMYIGDCAEGGLYRCVFEVVENSLDEHRAGYCKNIWITIHRDGSISIQDDGRGIPVELYKAGGIPAVEFLFTSLFAVGKFTDGLFKYSGQMRRGVKITNALSDWLKCEVFRDGKIHAIGFERGKTTEPLTVRESPDDPMVTGTKISFLPDATIFTVTDFDFERLFARLRELAFLNPGIKITLTDDRDETLRQDVLMVKAPPAIQ